MSTSIRLRELIKVLLQALVASCKSNLIASSQAVRSCKTSAEERAVIARESARIRTSFANNEVSMSFFSLFLFCFGSRHVWFSPALFVLGRSRSGLQIEMKPRNIAKLLYIHMLGYSTQFGALEVIALCAAPQFTAKRIGYLALMLLLDEDTELLMMVTNSLKQDLTHLNQFVVGLALSALANVGSAQMSRDLAPDIEKLLSSPNAYIRKKAALCAVRIVRKVPDMTERYAGKIKALLSDKNHGVLLTGLQLLIDLCQIDPSNVDLFRGAVPALVNMLKNLVISGHSPEYEIGGICDPFLQVKLLTTLRILGTRDARASDSMNDILSQVTTNTEALRNVGNAILYEAVTTILTIDANEGLRNLAINILGRFLVNRDNNIRYVALNTLSKVVNTNFSAVQRHRATIIDCLKDPDISIRRRALDLVYSLVNRKNIRPLVGELLGYLLVADEELRPDITAKLCMVTGRYAPSKKWHVDTILRVMMLAGQYIPENVIGDTVALVSQSTEVQPYAVRRFYSALKKEPAKRPLVYVAVWLLGEFGDLLIVADGDDLVVEEAEVIETLRRTLMHPVADALTRDYCLTALAKLAARFGPQPRQVIARLFEKYSVAVDLEVQTRAVEFGALLSSSHLQRVMDRVPPLVLHGDDFDYEGGGEDDEGTGDAGSSAAGGSASSSSRNRMEVNVATTSKPTQLIDLDGLFGGGGDGGGNAGVSNGPSSSGSAMDLLSVLGGGGGDGNSAPAMSAMDLMMSGGPISPPMSASSQGGSSHGGGGGGLDALLDMQQPGSNSGGAPVEPVQVAPPAPISVFDKNGIKIMMQFAPQADGILFVQLVSTNSSKEEVKSFTLLMAVPTYVKLQMAAPSGNVLASNGGNQVTQQVRIENSDKPKPTLVRLKVDFSTISAGKFSEVVNVASFPSHL